MADGPIDLHRILQDVFGFTHFRGPQESIVRHLLNGDDAFVILPTGGGKSLCYQLPALAMPGTAIVVSPLIALMKNQVDVLRGTTDEPGTAHVWNSSLTKREMVEVRKDLQRGVTKLLYVAPESLTKEENIAFLRSLNISFYAIDEAHCISEWGHDFRPEYRNLRAAMQEIQERPVIALTATATPKVQADILKTLGMEHATVFASSFNRPNLYYEVRPKIHVEREIVKLIKQHDGQSAIVYCLSRAKVEELSQQLQVNGIQAIPYHAGLDSNTRAKHQDLFLNEHVHVVVATIAFGMGIDKPDIRLVIHHDMPKSLESYYQETGRGGRDGGEGRCVSFYAAKDMDKLDKFLSKKPVSEQEIGKQLLLDAQGYAETTLCRRKYILHYFGEDYLQEDCGACDNCLQPREQVNAQEHLEWVLETVELGRKQFKALQVVNTLIGNLTAVLKTFNAPSLPTWGRGSQWSAAYWQDMVRHAHVRGWLRKDIEAYGIVSLTPAGEAFLSAPHPVWIAEYKEPDWADDPTPAKTIALDPVLFGQLKEITKTLSKKHGLPPYALFSDNSLSEMATAFPCSEEELRSISGVGEHKAKKFGAPLVAAIQAHVEANQIDRPYDEVIKAVGTKNTLKVFIIQSMDRRIPLPDIARSKKISMDDLLSAMEIIVQSGTKINLRYMLQEHFDEDSLDEVLDYFREDSEDGNIAQAMRDFDGVYSEEELRLVKLQFLSEVAS
jgi:ATP-dependent DNA helicase RecQ